MRQMQLIAKIWIYSDVSAIVNLIQRMTMGQRVAEVSIVDAHKEEVRFLFFTQLHSGIC